MRIRAKREWVPKARKKGILGKIYKIRFQITIGVKLKNKNVNFILALKYLWFIFQKLRIKMKPSMIINHIKFLINGLLIRKTWSLQLRAWKKELAVFNEFHQRWFMTLIICDHFFTINPFQTWTLELIISSKYSSIHACSRTVDCASTDVYTVSQLFGDNDSVHLKHNCVINWADDCSDSQQISLLRTDTHLNQ